MKRHKRKSLLICALLLSFPGSLYALETDRQQALGLYGALLISPKDPSTEIKADLDYTIQLQEWLKLGNLKLVCRRRGPRGSQTRHYFLTDSAVNTQNRLSQTRFDAFTTEET